MGPWINMAVFCKSVGERGPEEILNTVLPSDPEASPTALADFDVVYFVAIEPDGVVGPRKFEMRFTAPNDAIIFRQEQEFELVGLGAVTWNQPLRGRAAPLGTYWGELRYRGNPMTRTPLQVGWP